MPRRRLAFVHFGLALAFACLAAACVDESTLPSRNTTRADGARIQSAGGDTRGGGDMRGKGRGGEHKLMRMK